MPDVTAVDIGLLILRLTAGLILAGHGAQKLFGSFGGHGIEGTGGFMEMMGFRPGRAWAFLAGAGEFFGGLLVALGFLNPLGSISAMAVMVMATARAHWDKPIWVTEGGAELPLVNIAVFVTVAGVGPGLLSLDALWATSLPMVLTLIVLAVATVVTAAGIVHSSQNAAAASRAAAAYEQRVEEPVGAPGEVPSREPSGTP